MKIISFETRQGEVVRKIFERCGLLQHRPSRVPPRAVRPSQPIRSCPEPDFAPNITYEVDPDFLEHAHREDLDQA